MTQRQAHRVMGDLVVMEHYRTDVPATFRVKSATKIINTSLLSLSLCIVQAMAARGSLEIL